MTVVALVVGGLAWKQRSRQTSFADSCEAAAGMTANEAIEAVERSGAKLKRKTLVGIELERGSAYCMLVVAHGRIKRASHGIRQSDGLNF